MKCMKSIKCILNELSVLSVSSVLKELSGSKEN